MSLVDVEGWIDPATWLRWQLYSYWGRAAGDCEQALRVQRLFGAEPAADVQAAVRRIRDHATLLEAVWRKDEEP